MDSTKLLLLGGAGFAAWWFFFRTPGSAAPAGPTPAPPGSPVVVGALPVLNSNSLDTIHAQLMTTEVQNVDEWGWYLNNILAAMGKGKAPDPMPLFSAAIPNFDRAQKLAIADYWAVMAPALKTQLGLSGLGVYGGLAALSRRYH